MSEEVTSEHSGEYIRLVRLWQRRTRFSLIFAAVEDSSYRDTLIARLEKIAPSIRIDFDPDQEPLHLVTVLQNAHANGIHRAHICMKAGITIPALWWNKANVLRESMADALKGVLVFWLTDTNIQTAAHEAPDLWNWRETVLTFTAPTPVTFPSTIGGTPFNYVTSSEKKHVEERLAQIESYLATQDEADITTAHLLHEAAYAYERLGQLEKSEEAARQAAKLFALEGNLNLAALAKGKIADVLKARGRLHEALAIRQNEVIPILETIGDISRIAATKSKIADILQIYGQLDTALAILQNEVLPIYQQIGEVREFTMTKALIADILQTRGDLNEALFIRQNEILPILIHIGDAREAAITKGKIADILQIRGELDTALAIRKNEVLPIYEKIGDVREVAITKGKIADILQRYGQLDAVLAIRKNDELPIYEKIGDIRSAAVTKAQIADILQARGRLDEALDIRQTEVLPVLQQIGDVRGTAVAKAKIAVILEKKGQPDKALTLLRNEVLPIFEKHGYEADAATAREHIAALQKLKPQPAAPTPPLL